MEIAAGTHLGPYEILSLLGSGGMGQVYRARDTRLGREVAMKFSKLEFSDRFEQEARIIASLNHPHICRLYDVGPNYLVMELVEGAPLRTPLPFEKTLSYSEQILDALDAAHRKGIVHRDLKPANILITREGIKLLDFGVATFKSPLTGGADETLAEGVGTVTGTVQYMSPEQLKGRQVDGRSDLFSFGCLLYEMLGGKKAFESESTAGVVAAILDKEPEPLDAPPAITRVVNRALAKEPDDRFQSARDLRAALLWAAEPTLETVGPASGKSFRRFMIAAAVLILAAMGFAGFLLLRPRPPSVAVAFAVETPPGVVFNYLITASAIAPDGRFLVLRAAEEGGTPALWLRPIDSLAIRRLAGTEGGDYPFWSPDSKSIGYFAGGKLERLDILGGAPVVLCDADAANAVAGGAWSRAGTILFGDRRGLLQIPATGGAAVLVAQAKATGDEGPYGYPQFFPDGEHYLYFRESADSAREGIYVASLTAPRDGKQVLATATKAVYAPPVSGQSGQSGQLLFLKGRSLIAQPFNTAKFQLEGEPAQVAGNVSVLPALRAAAFWVSDQGTLVYRSGLGLGNETLSWISRDGRSRVAAAAPATFTSLQLSPDARRAAVGRQAVADFTDLSDLWFLDFEHNTTNRFTLGPEWNACPVWSPDGREIAFISSRSGTLEIYRKAVEGGAETLLPTGSPEFKCPMGWSRDGRYLVYSQSNGGVFDLWALPLAVPGKPFLVVPPPFDKPDAQFSPDGQWLAYTSNESGRYEVYVKAFLPQTGHEVTWQASNNGGRAPRWRGDGKELFYLSLDDKIEAATVAMPNRSAGTPPQELFAATVPGNLGENQYPYDVTPDGRRFLVEESAGPRGSAPLIVLVNWQSTLSSLRVMYP